MIRHHRMAFGAEILGRGRVDFRLWAPSAETVELCLEKGADQGILPMGRTDEGWYRLTADGNGETLYRYRINGRHLVPDPAARFQPRGVHGPSQVINPTAYEWRDREWRGLPWPETVIYELHVGAFSRAGTFGGVEERLDYLADLGITALEMMPVAQFPGRRGWGYDGVQIFAPAHSYGRPEELKRLIDEAHARNLQVFLDVVYNHFGPEGNYLHLYATPFFTGKLRTPWGDGLNFAGPESRWVRRFFIDNALYWLEEYHLDGLRLDAVHAIQDPSPVHILEELAETVRERFGEERHLHLILENDKNEARFLQLDAKNEAGLYDAQWNDDCHHGLHVLLTGESDGYYADYADRPAQHLARALAEGFAYQGEASKYRGGVRRGEVSSHLPPTSFVAFLQNHDQVGNRPRGERLTVLAPAAGLTAALAILLLAPAVPLLFLGEEWGCRQPFPYFCNFGPELAERVAAGRTREFAGFAGFDAEAEELPDPGDPAVFGAAVLDTAGKETAEGKEWLAFYRRLLALRRKRIIPLLARLKAGGEWQVVGPTAFRIRWSYGARRLLLIANLGVEACPGVTLPAAPPFFAWPARPGDDGPLPPWSVFWYQINTGNGKEAK